MGWVSGIACAVIAVYFIHRLLLSDTKRDTAAPTTPKPSALSSKTSTNTADDTVLKNHEAPSFTVTNSESRPDIVIEEKRKPASNGLHTSPSIRLPSVMPPPPLPPAPPQLGSQPPSLNMPPPRSKSPPRLKPPTFGPAPPRPAGSALMPPPSAASSLRVPPQKVLKNTSMQPSSSMPPPNKPSRQVVLEPGHSPLDWAALTSKPNNSLRGKDLPNHLIRVTPSQLKAQNGRKGKDAWTVYQGKVYNITPYVPFHPGGKGEILRGAAKDSVKLFMEVHPWVNWDGMLGECLVGILVSEDDAKEPNKLDEMD